ncbi:MAG: pseudouridine-5'-phosphate glycosidase [Rhodothermia bacterium]|nr:pseudouridine-5'-phosphate glycosidase [Rhodothermia bacterium]
MQPIVALESTVISHGLPYPQNLQLAHSLEAIIRHEGARPATIGIVEGNIIAGLNEAQIRLLATSKEVRKVSRRDLPIVVARRLNGATTVATTMWAAHRAGIAVFATGGIGGVHRGAGELGVGSMDISADLQELAQTPVTVVCAGAKAILDLPATLEYLETYGITVIGYQTHEFPAFYSRESGLTVDVRCDTPQEVAEIIKAKKYLNLPGGILVAVPIPEEAAIPRGEIEPIIAEAIEEAEFHKLRSAAVTPFLLKKIAEMTGERSLEANLALLQNNARVAAQIARAVTGLV